MSTVAKSMRRAPRLPAAVAGAKLLRWDRTDGWIAVGLSACVMILLFSRLDLGVVPGDTGALAHAAERASGGELPHLDFDEPYTGALSLLNGLAFTWFGTSVSTMRTTWLVFAVGFTALSYVVARGSLGRIAAAALVTAIVVWSVPNYPSPMPTWYNLFLAVLGGWCLANYATAGRRRWLVAAGMCGGASLLFKIVGLYFFAAAGLFLLYLAQDRSAAVDDGSRPANSATTVRGAAWRACAIIVGLACFALCVVLLVARQPRVPEFVVFSGPPLVLGGFLAVREWRLRHRQSRKRLGEVLRDAALFLAGAALPVALFVAPYVARGGVGALLWGVFVAPQSRVGDEFMGRPLAAETFWAAILTVAMIAGGAALSIRMRTPLFVSVVVGVVACLFVAQGDNVVAYGTVWNILRLLPVATAAAVVYFLAGPAVNVDDSHRRRLVFLWAAMAGVFGLVQFPLAHGIYFLYAAPLVLIAAAYALSYALPRQGAVIGGESVAFLIAFAACWVLGSNSTLLGVCYYPCNWNNYLTTQRAEERYDAATAQIYNTLIHEVRSRCDEGESILALPDSPEVYYLTRRRNPTRTFYDVFDRDYGHPERDQRLLRVIDEKRIKVVVLREWGTVSKKAVSPQLKRELSRRFPHELKIGDAAHNVFIVRWRERVEASPSRSDLASSAF